MSGKPHASFICGGSHVPASRFRVHPVVERLSTEGWETSLLHGYGPLDHRLSSGVTRRAYRAACRGVRAMRTATMSPSGPVMVQRLAWPWSSLPEQRLAKRGRGLVFDFDDAVFLDSRGHENRSRRNALNEVFAAASHVVAGNSWLAENVAGKAAVSVVPTCIDTSKYSPRDRVEERSTVRIGWIGTGGNLKYLEQLVAPFSALRESGHRFEFVICSDTADALLFARLGAKFEKWSIEGELPFLRSLDIGLMPLADDLWCRGKCSFKLIQYMAVGCPVVGSAVGLNKDAVRNEVDGFLVSENAWVEPLSDLIRSQQARLRFGSAARERAVQKFDLGIAIAEYRKILLSLQ